MPPLDIHADYADIVLERVPAAETNSILYRYRRGGIIFLLKYRYKVFGTKIRIFRNWNMFFEY